MPGAAGQARDKGEARAIQPRIDLDLLGGLLHGGNEFANGLWPFKPLVMSAEGVYLALCLCGKPDQRRSGLFGREGSLSGASSRARPSRSSRMICSPGTIRPAARSASPSAIASSHSAAPSAHACVCCPCGENRSMDGQTLVGKSSSKRIVESLALLCSSNHQCAWNHTQGCIPEQDCRRRKILIVASRHRDFGIRPADRVIALGDFVAPPLSWDGDFGVCDRICTARRLSVRENSPVAFQVRFPCDRPARGVAGHGAPSHYRQKLPLPCGQAFPEMTVRSTFPETGDVPWLAKRNAADGYTPRTCNDIRTETARCLHLDG